MNKHIFIIISFGLVFGALLFLDEIMAIFHGLSPLESLRMIWSFVLHVIVTTIIGTLVAGLVKIVRPWLRSYRRSQKRVRHQRNPQAENLTPRMPRVNKDQLLVWMAGQMSKVSGAKNTTPRQQQHTDAPQIRFK